MDDEIGAGDEIYIEGDDDDEVGAARARPRARQRNGSPAYRRKAFLPAQSITNGTTVAVQVVLNTSFKTVGMRLSGVNLDKLYFNGATIRGKPQEASAGSVGCDIFTKVADTFFEEWDTASPGESFTLSFTNTHTAAVTLNGYLVGFAAA